MAYLALRHTAPPGFFQGIFAKLTCVRLVTRYPHSGIVIDGVLYQSTLAKGVHSVSFDPVGWDLFNVSIAHTLLLDRFNNVKNSKYDWFSLFAFVLPFRITVGKWFYCYELCHYMLVGNVPNQRITPENLLTRIENGDSKNRALGMVY